jgi:hypothetical protein
MYESIADRKFKWPYNVVCLFLLFFFFSLMSFFIVETEVGGHLFSKLQKYLDFIEAFNGVC